jgi:hypothetical protein
MEEISMKKISLLEHIRGWFPQETAVETSNYKPKLPSLNKHPTRNDRLVGGLGAAGLGLVLSGIMFSYVPEYPKHAAEILIVVGIPLLVAAILVSIIGKRRTQGRQ